MSAPHLQPPTACTGPRRPLLAVAAFLVVACSPGGTEETAVSRGDVAFARDSLNEALAEYRLAVRQGGEDPETLARVAHTYARMGRVDEARDFWRRAIDEEAGLGEQAAADFIHMARRAAERGDRFQMASAMDAATTFRPGLSVQELALPLARHYFEAGEYGQALPFYQKALAATADSAPDLVYEIGQAHEQIGDCERALIFFERFRTMVRANERGEVDWYIGNCALQVAREKRQAARALEPAMPVESGRRRPSDRIRGEDRVFNPDTAAAVPPPLADTATATDSAGTAERSEVVVPHPPGSREELLEGALRLVNRTIDVGEPRNLLGQAWFERAEILAALGECEAALQAFDQVRLIEPTQSSALARRAQERYDQIRFGRGLRELMPGGRCG